MDPKERIEQARKAAQAKEEAKANHKAKLAADAKQFAQDAIDLAAKLFDEIVSQLDGATVVIDGAAYAVQTKKRATLTVKDYWNGTSEIVYGANPKAEAGKLARPKYRIRLQAHYNGNGKASVKAPISCSYRGNDDSETVSLNLNSTNADAILAPLWDHIGKHIAKVDAAPAKKE